VRTRISHDKATAEEYLEVHRVAHRLGMRTNATMLYGHIETFEHRVDHLLRLRALQDESGGFQAFIPLAFHPDGNGMKNLPAPTASTPPHGRVSRLMLDNVPHIKAYWVSMTPEVAQIALALRRRRPRRDDRARDDLPRGRIASPAGLGRTTSSCASFAKRGASRSSATRSTTSSRARARARARGRVQGARSQGAQAPGGAVVTGLRPLRVARRPVSERAAALRRLIVSRASARRMQLAARSRARSRAASRRTKPTSR
jgi:hypothetical protein